MPYSVSGTNNLTASGAGFVSMPYQFEVDGARILRSLLKCTRWRILSITVLFDFTLAVTDSNMGIYPSSFKIVTTWDYSIGSMYL